MREFLASMARGMSISLQLFAAITLVVGGLLLLGVLVPFLAYQAAQVAGQIILAPVVVAVGYGVLFGCVEYADRKNLL